MRGEAPLQHLLSAQSGRGAARGARECAGRCGPGGAVALPEEGGGPAGRCGVRGRSAQWGRAAAGRPTRLSLQCKFQRDKLLINSLEEKAVSFFLLFFLCFYFCMAPSYALGSLTAQQFSLFQYPKENANRHAVAF